VHGRRGNRSGRNGHRDSVGLVSEADMRRWRAESVPPRRTVGSNWSGVPHLPMGRTAPTKRRGRSCTRRDDFGCIWLDGLVVLAWQGLECPPRPFLGRHADGSPERWRDDASTPKRYKGGTFSNPGSEPHAPLRANPLASLGDRVGRRASSRSPAACPLPDRSFGKGGDDHLPVGSPHQAGFFLETSVALAG
jgi:hypothetical protein